MSAAPLTASNASTSPSPERREASPHPTALSPPPPSHLELYGRKPLPPIPATAERVSSASKLSKEMNRAFDTHHHAAHGNDIHHHHLVDFAKTEEADQVQARRSDWSPSPPPSSGSSLPKMMKIATRKARRRVDTAVRAVPNTPPDELLSPQPRSSVQKILKLTSVRPVGNSNTSSSPSGHNSPHKIKQLMGMDIGPEEKHRRLLGENRADVSPLSNRSSSVYSQDLDTAISETDSLDIGTNTEGGGGSGYASDPTSSLYFAHITNRSKLPPSSHPAVPSPLNLSKDRFASDGSSIRSTAAQLPPPQTPSPRGFARSSSRDGSRGRSHGSSSPSDRYARDIIYHTPPRQTGTWSNPYSPEQYWQLQSPPEGSRAPPVTPRTTWMAAPTRHGGTQIPPGYSTASSGSMVPLPLSHSPSPHGSGGGSRFASPAHSASASASDHPLSRTVSTGTFGDQHQHQHQYQHQHSPSPSSRSYEHYHHQNHSSDHRSIITTASSDREDLIRTGSPSPRKQRRSLMSKVFSPKRATAETPVVTSPLLDHPATSPSSSASPGKSFSSWRQRYRRGSTNSSGAPVVDEASWMGSLSLSSSPRKMSVGGGGVAAMGSLVGDMVEHARVAAGIRTRAERRRESLKSKIVVVGERGERLGVGEGRTGGIEKVSAVAVRGGGVGVVGGTAAGEKEDRGGKKKGKEDVVVGGMVQGDSPWI
ncbi:hypothetical protein QBC47DRAFT_446870 [Echria macrotheca]|uniref:Uncharacterized protein n=1 Tax=Echria macrotheca TaxID=438768 RepID=A0AAJ0BC56_9PEZI|nr:hypothetical protein QBC47DRAFT_446870 [Echria macrotheca]